MTFTESSFDSQGHIVYDAVGGPSVESEAQAGPAGFITPPWPLWPLVDSSHPAVAL